ncbi:hypothetical protein SAY86_013145 [Trapa natans]|uniref:Thaumatin-like protein 1b n=1 Tax=Trapa natans TaxID=22666 RepID=A0AAN7RCA3_TRANT|nr:hypothetical protein SAY86_013145 [Trapa natans]
MARVRLLISTLALLISPLMFCSGVETRTFTVVNKCNYMVWPGILSNAGEPALSTTGFALQKGQSRTISAPAGWGGRFWGRTHCTEDPTTGNFSCLTGDCSSSKLECSGGGAAPPATLAEFKLDGSGGLDFFDVSLVDGYNLPMLVVPQGGSGANCTSTGCVADLIVSCPSELRVTAEGEFGGRGVACQSACGAFQQPQYCCSGSYGSPDTCRPSQYSAAFKSACPRAYSYAYDDRTSTFTCASADFVITFCPSPRTSQKSASSDQTPAAATTAVAASTPASSEHINSTMVYEGVMDISGASVSAHLHVSSPYAITAFISLAVAISCLP